MAPPSSYPIGFSLGGHYQWRDLESGAGISAAVRSRDLLSLGQSLSLDIGAVANATWLDATRVSASPELLLDFHPDLFKEFSLFGSVSPVGLDLTNVTDSPSPELNLGAALGVEYGRMVALAGRFDFNVTGEAEPAFSIALTTDLLKTAPLLWEAAKSVVPAEPAIPAQKPELLPVAAVQAVELIPGHNKNGIGRENIVFVSVEYEGDADLADAQYEEVSRKFVEATFAHAPFAGNKELFNFSIVKLPVKLKRTEADMCFGSAPDLAALSQEVAAKTGLPNVQIVNLLATDCRSQASWFDFTSGENIYREFAANMDWEKLIAKFSDPETQRELASDASAVYRMISDAADMEEIARKIFPLFEAPIANVSLEVSPRNSVVSNHIPWVGVHEFGHSFGRLWDLYSEAGTDGFAEIIQDLNRERSLADLLKQYAGVDLPFLSGIRFNLFKLLARHPAIEKVIGEKIGEPHCAITKEEAREWWGPFKGEGEGDQQVTFDELGWNEGCLYMTDQFFRSSKASRMRQSHSADSRFDPVEIAHIQKRLDAIRERMRKIQAQK